MIAIIKNPNYRIDKITDDTNPVSEHEIEAIVNNSTKIMTDRGIKRDDGHSNLATNQNLIAIIKNPNYRIDKITDVTNPVSEHEIEAIVNNSIKIMTDRGTVRIQVQLIYMS